MTKNVAAQKQYITINVGVHNTFCVFIIVQSVTV